MKKNKKILFISPVIWNYYPYRDQELPTALAEKGFSCIYLNPLRYKDSDQAARFAEVNDRKAPEGLLVIDRTTKLSKSFVLFIYENYLNYKAVKKLKPCVVISTNHLMVVPTCLYCRFRGIKFIFDVTDNWELVDKSLAGHLYKFLLKPLLSHYSFAITTTSHAQFDYFHKHRKSHTYLISNGISPETFTILKTLTIHPEKSKEVNFIGSLRDWYDFDLLFNVFASFPDITLNIYGQGPLLDELKEKAANISNIRLHGNIDNRLTSGFLKKTLFGVLPLRQIKLNQSTSPIKLFDYWGASKAVIATPVDEVKKIGGDTLLYASDQKEFLEKAQMLISNPDLAIKLGREGFNKVIKIHNYDVITKKFIHLINL